MALRLRLSGALPTPRAILSPGYKRGITVETNRKSYVCVLVGVLTFGTASAGPTEVYKWVGSDGVTHYAESSPEASIASLEIVDIDTTRPATTGPGYQGALDVANDIETSRLERERVRLEKQKLLLEERQIRQSQQAAQQRSYANNDDLSAYPLRRNHHRYNNPRPPHPPAHTPDPAPAPHGGTTSRVHAR